MARLRSEKTDVRLHALSFYTRTAGRSARDETRTPTVIGLFCKHSKVIGLSGEIPLVSHSDVTSNVTDW